MSLIQQMWEKVRLNDQSEEAVVRPWSHEEAPHLFIFNNQVSFYALSSLMVPHKHQVLEHSFQDEQVDLWNNLGEYGRFAYDHAIQEIDELKIWSPESAPQGFRLICNFAPPASQSQPHAHLQIHADQALDQSRFAPTGEPWVHAAVATNSPIVHETQNTLFYDVWFVLEKGHEQIQQTLASVGIYNLPFQRTPQLAALAVPRKKQTQHELWNNSDDLSVIGADIVAYANAQSKELGFRLIANFPGEQRRTGGWGPAHILIIGDAGLNLYADYS